MNEANLGCCSTNWLPATQKKLSTKTIRMAIGDDLGWGYYNNKINYYYYYYYYYYY